MGRCGLIVVVFVFILASNTCSASLVFLPRKLITNVPSNASNNSSVSPTGSPTPPLNKVPKSSPKPGGTKHKDSHKGNQNGNTLPPDSKDAAQNSTDGNPSTGKRNVDKVDRGNEKADSHTAPKLVNNDSCEGPLTRCRLHEMIACVKGSNNGSAELILIVQNEGKSDIKVVVYLSDYFNKPSLAFEVPKQNATRKDILSIVGKNTTLYVNSTECVLRLANPTSVDNLIQQFSFYSKQVTPIYAVYGAFLLLLLFGGTWVCFKFNRRHKGVPYQELEMGFPESTASAANVDNAVGWDHDWDDDDWDEETAVKSPAVHHVRNISVDGLTSRSPKKDGWDWED